MSPSLPKSAAESSAGAQWGVGAAPWGTLTTPPARPLLPADTSSRSPFSAPGAVERGVAAETEVEATAVSKKKEPKLSKLQLKMEAARKKKEQARKIKAIEEAAEAAAVASAKAAAEGKAEAETAEVAPMASGGTRGSGGTAGRAIKRAAKVNVTEETKAKRVFNAVDDEIRDVNAVGPTKAQLEVELSKDISEYGPDGKKLTKKELKKLYKDRNELIRQAAEAKEAEKRSAEGAQFSCSQTAIDENDPMWMNALDINIPSITISAYNKNLFVDAPLTIAQGRHYGLVGPNGKGKSTLLKMIASGALKIPPRIDALYVEQEVVADHTPAFEAVLMADKVRWALVEEERDLLDELVELEEKLDGKVVNKVAIEQKNDRLAAVHEEMGNIDAEGAEPKARRILFGLGFDRCVKEK
jgi:ABC-type glutathione transport system ATPase component